MKIYSIGFFGYHPCAISWSVVTWGVSLVSLKVACTPPVDTALFLSARYPLITIVSAVITFH